MRTLLGAKLGYLGSELAAFSVQMGVEAGDFVQLPGKKDRRLGKSWSRLVKGDWRDEGHSESARQLFCDCSGARSRGSLAEELRGHHAERGLDLLLAAPHRPKHSGAFF